MLTYGGSVENPRPSANKPANLYAEYTEIPYPVKSFLIPKPTLIFKTMAALIEKGAGSSLPTILLPF